MKMYLYKGTYSDAEYGLLSTTKVNNPITRKAHNILDLPINQIFKLRIISMDTKHLTALCKYDLNGINYENRVIIELSNLFKWIRQGISFEEYNELEYLPYEFIFHQNQFLVLEKNEEIFKELTNKELSKLNETVKPIAISKLDNFSLYETNTGEVIFYVGSFYPTVNSKNKKLIILKDLTDLISVENIRRKILYGEFETLDASIFYKKHINTDLWSEQRVQSANGSLFYILKDYNRKKFMDMLEVAENKQSIKLGTDFISMIRNLDRLENIDQLKNRGSFNPKNFEAKYSNNELTLEDINSSYAVAYLYGLEYIETTEDLMLGNKKREFTTPHGVFDGLSLQSLYANFNLV